MQKKRSRRPLTAEDVKAIQEMRKKGFSINDIGRVAHRGQKTVRMILYGKHPKAMTATEKGQKEKTLQEMSRDSKRDTLCWFCANACGGCSWSSVGLPVEGWDAEPRELRMYYNMDRETVAGSFHVKHCPQFIEDGR